MTIPENSNKIPPRTSSLGGSGSVKSTGSTGTRSVEVSAGKPLANNERPILLNPSVSSQGRGLFTRVLQVLKNAVAGPKLEDVPLKFFNRKNGSINMDQFKKELNGLTRELQEGRLDRYGLDQHVGRMLGSFSLKDIAQLRLQLATHEGIAEERPGNLSHRREALTMLEESATHAGLKKLQQQAGPDLKKRLEPAIIAQEKGEELSANDKQLMYNLCRYQLKLSDRDAQLISGYRPN